MLVLTRKAGETIMIGDEVTLTVSSISGNRIKVCIDAPRECTIRRSDSTPPPATPAQTIRIPAGAVAQ